MIYGGFWKRFAAGLVDFLVLLPFYALRWWLDSISVSTALSVVVPFSSLYFAYNIYFHGRWGQTVGKMAVGIRVVKVSGERISWREAFLRNAVDVGFAVLTIISSVIALLNFPEEEYLGLGRSERLERLNSLRPACLDWVVWASMVWVSSEVVVLLFNKKRRAIHDFIAGTVVIHTRTAGDTADGTPEA
ncbi:RDD family protein [bacterium]|nr:RDD family protein [bacterium]